MIYFLNCVMCTTGCPEIRQIKENPEDFIVKMHKNIKKIVCIFKWIPMHKYSSKIIKNEGNCQKNNKIAMVLKENEGNEKKIIKKIEKYSKRGWQIKNDVV